MARQKGLFKIIGTLDDVNFYVIKGVGYARKAGGGFNGSAIKSKDSMQRVRENGSEFGHCSRVKKQFRLALLPFLKDNKGKEFHTRLMQLFLELKSLDSVSERGKRSVFQGLKTAKGKQLFDQFEFTPKNTILNTLNSKASFDWNTQTMSIENFNPSGFKFPKAATHLEVTLGVLDFDFESLDSSLEVSSTNLLPIAADNSSFELRPNVVNAPEYVGIAVMGMRYYEVIGTELYGLETSLGAHILGCVFPD